MSISTALTSVKNNFGKYLIKGTGLAALGIIAYDAHIVGNLQSDIYSKSADANACLKRFENTQYLSSPSLTTEKLKKHVFNMETEGNTRHFFNSAIGYFKGFGSMLVSNVLPLGLGIGALFGKGKWAKYSAIGLGVYAGMKIIKDVLCLGHPKDLVQKF